MADQHHLADRLALSPAATRLLDYLAHDLPGYPYDPEIDRPFVDELDNDFPHVDLLEQIKLYRWYHDNDPPYRDHPRAAIRRWICGAARRGSRRP